MDKPTDLVRCPLDALGIDIDVAAGVVLVRSEWPAHLDAVISWAAYNMLGLLSVDTQRLDDGTSGDGSPRAVSFFKLNLLLGAKLLDPLDQVFVLRKPARKEDGLWRFSVCSQPSGVGGRIAYLDRKLFSQLDLSYSLLNKIDSLVDRSVKHLFQVGPGRWHVRIRHQHIGHNDLRCYTQRSVRDTFHFLRDAEALGQIDRSC